MEEWYNDRAASVRRLVDTFFSSVHAARASLENLARKYLPAAPPAGYGNQVKLRTA
jgi:hypothetical protein